MHLILQGTGYPVSAGSLEGWCGPVWWAGATWHRKCSPSQAMSETPFRCAGAWRPQRHSRHFWWHQSMEWGHCDDIVALDSLISVSFAHIHLQIMQHVFCLLVGMRKVFLRLRLIYKRYSFVSLLIWCMFLCFLAFFSLTSYWSGCRNAHAVRTPECLASSMDLTETLVPLMDLVIAFHLGICYFWWISYILLFWSIRNDLFRWLVPDSWRTWKQKRFFRRWRTGGFNMGSGRRKIETGVEEKCFRQACFSVLDRKRSLPELRVFLLWSCPCRSKTFQSLKESFQDSMMVRLPDFCNWTHGQWMSKKREIAKSVAPRTFACTRHC